ncbi:MAG: TatD family hydrolase [Dehalococcoidia bacterium]|nr:TatD family hydrolase [Dehalococcoidia bacterium]
MIVDTHAHLDVPDFEGDRRAVILRALEQDVGAIVAAGCDLESSRVALALAEAYPWVYAAVGFHPHEASRLTTAILEELARLAGHSKVVAVGEIGLDFYRNRSPREAQEWALEAQLDMASSLGLPVIVHCRQADAEVLSSVKRWVNRRHSGTKRPVGVLHCFSGDEKQGMELIELGFLLSFAGPLTFPRAQQPKRVAAALPLSSLLVETDSPYLTPSAHYGQRNEPAFVWAVARGLAEVKGLTLEEVASITTANAQRLFGLSLTRKEDFGHLFPVQVNTGRPA